jgi:DNA-binding CsgD family transcriptional regulator/PAS domain-containing protein
MSRSIMGAQAGNSTALIAPHRLSTVVGAIYDSAIDPQRWREALRELCVDLRCLLSAIYLYDAQNSCVRHVKASDDASERVVHDKDYMDTATASLRLLPMATQPIDEPFASSRIVSDYSAFTDSRYFREIVIPRGHGDGVHVVLARSSRRFGLFSATRHLRDGPMTDVDLAILRLLAPHIRRAITISDLMELKALEAESLSATLDRLAMGVVVVSNQNRILHANEAARDMLANGGSIVSRRGRLAARDSAADAELSHAIELSASDEATLGGAGIGVSLGSPDEQPALAHVLPLARGEVRTRLMPRATAAVFINTAEPRPQPDLRALAQTFGLTAAEARVAERLLAGAANLAEVAASLDVSLATVKTHLSQVFAKTGVSRQSDLVALMHRMTPSAR